MRSDATRRTLTVSLERKSLIALCLAAGIYGCAAFLANEWLYLLSCALVVAVSIGYAFPAAMLQTITASCWLPLNAVALEDSDIAISIGRPRWLGFLGWLLPIESLRARILLARREVGGYAVEQVLSKQPILLEHITLHTSLKLHVPQLRRGIYKMAAVEVSSGFPFGMSQWTRSIETNNNNTEEETITVFPISVTLNGGFLLELQGQLSSMGLSFTEKLALTHSTNVRAIREFRVGDSLRHIHWRSSARLGKMLVREFDSETLPVFDLYLNLCANWADREQFELAVCLTTSLINFGYEHDISPHLHIYPALDSLEMETLMYDLPSAIAPLDELMQILARVEPLPSRSPQIPDAPPNRELLSVQPCNDPRMGSNGGQLPVQLIALSSRSANRQGTVIATVYGAQELRAL